MTGIVLKLLGGSGRGRTAHADHQYTSVNMNNANSSSSKFKCHLAGKVLLTLVLFLEASPSTVYNILDGRFITALQFTEVQVIIYIYILRSLT